MARGKTYNATPSFAYQLNNWLSIGAGVQIERAPGLPDSRSTASRIRFATGTR
jgi:long-subunit fatty acid transport protein